MARKAKWLAVRRPDGFPTTIALPYDPEEEEEWDEAVSDPLFPSFVVSSHEYVVADYGRSRPKPDFVKKDKDNDKPIRWRKL